MPKKVKENDSTNQPIGVLIGNDATEVKSGSLYRGTPEGTGDVFSKGFIAQGTTTDLVSHLDPEVRELWSESSSAYISTSKSRQVATSFAAAEEISGFLYEINHQSNGIDIEKFLKKIEGANPQVINSKKIIEWKAEKEIAVPYKINPQDIKGAWQIDAIASEIRGGGIHVVEGTFIPNPDYTTPLAVRIAPKIKFAGYALTGVGAAIDGANLYQAYQSSKASGDYHEFYKEGGRIIAGWSAAFAMGMPGAKAGAILCSPLGPMGSLSCGVGGAFVGSAFGYVGGSTIATNLLNNDENNQSRMVVYQPKGMPNQHATDWRNFFSTQPPQQQQQQQDKNNQESNQFEQPKPSIKRKDEKKLDKHMEPKMKKDSNSHEPPAGKTDQEKDNAKQEHQYNAQYQEAYKRAKFSENYYRAQKAFAEAASIGESFQSKNAVKGVMVMQSFSEIAKAVDDIVSIPWVGEALSLIAETQPYLTILSNVFRIFNIISSGKQNDPTIELMNKNHQEVMERFAILEKIVREVAEKTGDRIIIGLSAQADRIIYSVMNDMKAKHGLQLSNIYHIDKSLGMYFDYWGNILSSLAKSQHLDKLDKLLIRINSERNGERHALSLLIGTKEKLEGIWLLKNLIGSNYNSECYSSESSKLDMHFVGKGIHPEIALGFMLNYAVNKLEMSLELADIDSKNLPHSDLFALSQKAYEELLLLMTINHNYPLPKALPDALKKVPQNTILMIDTLAENANVLFSKLILKHTDAQNKLLKVFKGHLKETLKESNRYYSLGHVLQNNYIDLPSLSEKINVLLPLEIGKKAEADKLTIPLILVIAIQMGLVKFDIEEEYARFSASAGWKQGLERQKGKTALFKRSIGVDYRFKIKVSSKDEHIEIFSAHMLLEQVEPPAIYYEKNNEYPKQEKIALEHANNVNELTDDALVSVAPIKSVSTNINLKAAMNDHFLDKVVEAIIAIKMNEEPLPAEIEFPAEIELLYKEAIDKLIKDAAGSAEAIDELIVSKQMMLAYSDAIGLPGFINKDVSKEMLTDPNTLLNNLLLMTSVKLTLHSILQEIEKHIPNRNSRVVAKMLALQDSSDNFEEILNQYHQYHENLSSWTDHVKALKYLESQYKHMYALHKANAVIIDIDTLYNFRHSIDDHRKSLDAMYLVLLGQHMKVTRFGFNNITKPDTVLGIINSVPDESVQSKESKFILDDNDLDYSVKDTAEYIEGSDQYLDTIPCMQEEADFIIGKTGQTKTTTLCSRFGSVYEEYPTASGATKVRVINGVEEIAKTGEGDSVTTRPEFYTRGDRCYVDFPGWKDTRGTEVDISNAFLLSAVAEKFKTLRVIEAQMTDANIYDKRNIDIKDVFGKVAKIIAHNPSRLIDNILITVTIPNQLKLAKNGPAQYESEVVNHLKEWLATQTWFTPENPQADKHPEYDLARFISVLEPKHVFVYDVTNPGEKERSDARIAAISPRNIKEFNFNNFDKKANGFKVFTQKYESQVKDKMNKRDETIGVIVHQWRQYARKNLTAIPQPSAWPELYMFHHDLVTLAEKMNQQFDEMDVNHEITGNVPQLVQLVVRYTAEINEEKPLVERLNKITMDFERRSFQMPENTVHELPMRNLAANTFGQPLLSLPGVDASFDGPTSLYFSSSVFNQNFDLMRVGYHLLCKLIGTNCTRALTEDDTKALRRILRDLKGMNRRIANLRDIIMVDGDYFARHLDALKNNLSDVVFDIRYAFRNNVISNDEFASIRDGKTRILKKLIFLDAKINEGIELQKSGVTGLRYNWFNEQYSHDANPGTVQDMPESRACTMLYGYSNYCLPRETTQPVILASNSSSQQMLKGPHQ